MLLLAFVALVVLALATHSTTHHVVVVVVRQCLDFIFQVDFRKVMICIDLKVFAVWFFW